MALSEKYSSHGKAVSKRKKRNTALETALKKSIGNQLKPKFGCFTKKGPSQLIFNGIRVLCKYSSFNSDQSRWFWGVAKTYWQDWRGSDYLALIFESAIGQKNSYLLFSSEEAKHLFSYCSDSGGEKKINMRIYGNDNRIKLQEWKDFDVHVRTIPLPLDLTINIKPLIPNKLLIAIGGYMGPSYQLELKSGNLIYAQFASGYKKIGEKTFHPSAEEWEKFWQVADDVDIWNWEKEYRNPNILDGTSWRIHVRLKDKEADSQGSNQCPDGDKFFKLLSAVRQLINNKPFN